MKKLIYILFFVGLTNHAFSQSSIQQSSFLQPPQEAKPRVWWHWMNGNITKEGIRKDLDWMEKTGIGGFQNFDANLFTPVVVEEKLVFMTPAWKEAFQYATDLAGDKELEMAIAGSPGWSVTGGPWVTPEDAMKKYVWTETLVKGGESIQILLPQPSAQTGKYQDAHVEGGGISGGFIGEEPKFYKDALVVAFPVPENEKSIQELDPKITRSGGDFDPNLLLDGQIDEGGFLPPMEVGEDMWIQYAFDQSQTFKAMSVSGAMNGALAEFNGGPENRSLKVSEDGVNFRTIAKVSGSTVPFNTVSFAPVTAKYWRICFETLPGEVNLFAAMAGGPMEEPKPAGVQVAEFQLYTTSRIDQVEDKAGFSPWTEDYALAEMEVNLSSDEVLPKNQIIDLTSQMKPDGSFSWNAPAGKWKIIRFGYSLTGRQNHPASPEATGLEVDKLDKEAVRRYINHYLDLYEDATGGKLGPEGLEYMILDSYEAGHMTWTADFPIEFEKRRGYSMVPYVPVLTGMLVNSREDSEKFLWDFRKTIGEMISDNHYDVIGEELHKRGMRRYTESHENKRIYLADGMDVKRHADIPMSAMWTPGSLAGGSDEEVRSEADIRESASVANIYGKPFVAAESMTSVGRPFQEYPERLKRTADLELASGLNRFVIHTSVHQPLDDKKPGFSLGPFGQYFTRQETWADMAKPWIDYLGRSSYMLQQGRNVADILYYYGENTNITWLAREELPTIPSGYEFDFVNSTVLKEAITADGGRLKAKSGNTYEVLMLDESAKLMTLSVLEKLKSLADAGVKIIGKKPVKSPSLSDNEEVFKQLANEIWELENVGENLQLPVQPDVSVSGTDHEILFRHRKSATADIYWFNNRNVNPTQALVSVRTSGKLPLKWNPITGETEGVSYEVIDGRTEIPLDFESWGAFFIVFEGDLTVNSVTFAEKSETEVQKVTGPWKVDFGGLVKDFSTLTSWSTNEDQEIKYYSGTANYTNIFNLPEKENEAKYELDLGSVKYLAEVILNGKNLGIVWKTPFKLDITKALKQGENQLEIRVVNTWVNRLIGDAQTEANTSTFTTMPFYQANSPLMESGLLGPVKIMKVD
ncbi:glycosyl hydrolase [Algoriphagus halophilus]|uniref:Glycosyl hydrolases family 2, sugar binding domain n=1 Tax=Algoriphagus halophilus TaxID=226505 RepID=A0A1N6D5E8_9BACT|nr:glycosyl hydrolase [Algoriphagus halophilus]SIN66060.1 Glycosyl hydrolases family 2, sugar binding domain [Algoriphagus halophilus]